MNAGDLSAREYLVELEQDRAELDVLIVALRRRLSGAEPPPPSSPSSASAAAPPTRRAAPAKATGKGHSQLTDAQLARMRKEWEAGVPASTIATHVKVSEVTVRNRAKAGGWKRPTSNGTPATKAVPPARTPKGEQLAGSVRCDHCQTMTDYDPCRACGKNLTKAWTR